MNIESLPPPDPVLSDNDIVPRSLMGIFFKAWHKVTNKDGICVNNVLCRHGGRQYFPHVLRARRPGGYKFRLILLIFGFQTAGPVFSEAKVLLDNKDQEIERLKQEVMEPCQKQYDQNKGLSMEEKTENMVDCLLVQSQNSLNNKNSSELQEEETEGQSKSLKEPLLGSSPAEYTHTGAEAIHIYPEEEKKPYDYVDLQVHFSLVDEEYSGQMEFDAVLPLKPLELKDRALFGQVGFVLSLRNFSGAKPVYEHNHLLSMSGGVVYRWTFHKGILGLNVFYDRQHDLDNIAFFHDRVGLGLDFQASHNIFSFNHYIPLKGWQDLDEFYEERAVPGWDLSFQRLFTPKIEGTGQFSYWDYQTEKDKSISSLGLNYKLNCETTIGMSVSQDLSNNETTTSLQYKRVFGLPEEQTHSNCLQAQYESQKKGLLLRPVEREKEIRLEHKRKALRLIIPDQEIRVGARFSYQISRKNFRSVKENENPGLLITSLPDWLSFDKETQNFFGVPQTPGVYNIRGSLFLPQSSLKNSFHFKITVQEARKAPSINVGPQTVLLGSSKLVLASIASPTDEEDCEVTLDSSSDGGPEVRYVEETQQLDIDCRDSEEGTYAVTGVVECEDEEEGGSLSGNIGFVCHCVSDTSHPPGDSPSDDFQETDSVAPVLSAQDQTVRYGETLLFKPMISNLSLNESFIVYVNPLGTGGLVVSYDSESNQFIINAQAATTPNHVITGTITDENNNFSRWFFKVTVVFNPAESLARPLVEEYVDDQAPLLLAQNQSVPKGESLNYTPRIDRLSLNESFIVYVNPLGTGGLVVSYDSESNQFIINAQADSVVVKTYNILGTIQDGSGNFSAWSFKVTVTEPLMTLDPPPPPEGTKSPDLVIDPPLEDPTDDPTGDPPTSPEEDPTGNPPTRPQEDSTDDPTEDPPGDSTTHLETDPPARPPANPQAPLLTAEDQTLRKGASLHYMPSLSNLRSGEIYTVTVHSPSQGAPVVTWDNSHSRFVINAMASFVAVKEHHISGTISDQNNNSSQWSFKIKVIETHILSPEGPSPEDPPTDSSPEDPPQEPETPPADTPETPPASSEEDSSTDSSPEDPPTSPPADTQAPTLTAQAQTVEIEESKTHTPTIGNTQTGEILTVTVNNVPQGAPAVTWDSTQNRFTINAGSASLGQYTISGTLKDQNENSSAWSFKVTVVDTQAPTLQADNQRGVVAQSFSFAPTIGNTRTGEVITVTLGTITPSSGKPAVSWDSTNKKFSIQGDLAGTWTISGTIKDQSNNQSPWSFKATFSPAQDTQAPTLRAQDKTVEIGRSHNIIHGASIGNTQSGEVTTVTMNSVPQGAPSVAWSATHKRFTINAGSASLGIYTISGTIKDQNNNSNRWSFRITVVDTIAPLLQTQNQTVGQGNSINYSPTINSIRSGEVMRVTVNSLSQGAPAVTWDSTHKRFTINAGSASLGQHTISGVIRDASNNSSNWSFKVTVTDTQAPTLSLSDQTIEQSESFNSQPTIRNLRAGEAFTVTVSSLTPTELVAEPTVTWDSTNNRFVIRAGDSPGTYTVSGNIRDSSNNSSSWSFRVIVQGVAIPTLTASDQRIKTAKKAYHTPRIGGVLPYQSWTVTNISVTPSSDTTPRVTWDSVNSRFVIQTANKTGVYRVTGTIRKGLNSSTWSFRVTVY